MAGRIYPPKLQLNKANASDAETPFLIYIYLSQTPCFIQNYDKRDDFNSDKVNFPFLDWDVPRSISNGVYISQLIRVDRGSSHVNDFQFT